MNHREADRPGAARREREADAGGAGVPVASDAFVAAFAARVLAAAPARGACRVVAVDGYAGSGKTTLAARLAAAFGARIAAGPTAAARPGADLAVGDAAVAHGSEPVAAPVVHTDELATHEDFFDWDGRLVAQVLAPLAAGRDGGYAPYDWVARAAVGRRVVPAGPVVVVEGVGSVREALRPWLAAALWLDVPPEVATARGMSRDGPELAGFWHAWTASQRAFFAAERPWRHAEAVRPWRGVGTRLARPATS